MRSDPCGRFLCMAVPRRAGRDQGTALHRLPDRSPAVCGCGAFQKSVGKKLREKLEKKEQMQKRRGAGFPVLTLALCAALGMALLLSGCEMPLPFPAGSSSDVSSVPVQVDTLPESAQSEEGVVLDASDGLLILRTVYNVEYVFRMTDVDDRVEGGVSAGQYVRVWYNGQLEGTNARNVKLLRIESAQEQQADALALGSTVEGFITEFDEETVSIETASGKSYRFVAAENVRVLSVEMHEGMWVRIYFDGTPDGAVVTRLTESAAAADVFTLVGTLRGVDEEEDTISIVADTGAWYTFGLGNAEVDAPNGLWAGTRRYVLSYRGSASPDGTENAMLLRMQAENLAAAQSVQGVVCAVNSNWGSIDLCTADGRVLSFALGSSAPTGVNGVQLGDTVCIEYTGCISGDYTGGAKVVSLEVRSRAGLGESSVLGTVRSVSQSALTLSAADGRTLKFKTPEGMIFPETMQSGDTVRVSYRGWIAEEEMENAVFVSVSRAYD